MGDVQARARGEKSPTPPPPGWPAPPSWRRKLALERLRMLCRSGLFSINDFRTNPLRIFAAHEVLALADVSAATKLTVQYNLFGGTVLKLGTQRHHDLLLKGIDSLEDVGCFGLVRHRQPPLALPRLAFCRLGSAAAAAAAAAAAPWPPPPLLPAPPRSRLERHGECVMLALAFEPPAACPPPVPRCRRSSGLATTRW
jgi:hypothetical protein